MRYPWTLEHRYERLLLSRCDVLRRLTLQEVHALAGHRGDGHADADPVLTGPALTAAIGRLRALLRGPLAPAPAAVQGVGDALDKRTTTDLSRAIATATRGRDLTPTGQVAVQRVGQGAARDRVDRWVRDNVALIKTIDDRYFDELARIIAEHHAGGITTRELTKVIADRYGVSQSNARRIARDQIGKLNGDMHRYKQTRIGITHYRWRCSMDERVRGNPGGLYPDAHPSHWVREGQLFAWADPPHESEDDGHPGTPIQDRCTAEPEIPADW